MNYEKWRGLTSLITTMVILAMIHRTSAHFSTLVRNSAQSSIERPERAALEPPTVTSLKPPERKSDDHGTRGISVQGEHSGSYIPPVVASRSPSSSYPRNYKSRYMHVDTHVSQPLAPVATAASGSQRGHSGAIAGRRSPYDTHHRPIVPPPTTHLLNSTTVPVYNPPHWNPSAPYIPRNNYGSSGYPPVPRSHPRSPSLHGETMLPGPPFATSQDHEIDQYNGGGVWGEAEEEQTGIWEYPKRHPGYPHGHHSIVEGRLRKDTFGHQISEDLSHLSGRRSNPRGSLPEEDEDIHIIHQNPSNPHSHFETHIIQESSPPVPREQDKIFSGGFGGPPATYGSHPGSGQAPRAYVPPQHSVTYGEVQEGHHHRGHGSPRIDGHESSYSDPVSPPEKGIRRPMTAYGISQTHNASSVEEFVELLKRRGIKVGQVVEKLRDGATREEMIAFLSSSGILDSQPEQRTDDQLEDLSTLMTSAEIEDGPHRHSGGRNREGRKKNRKGRNKNKGRKNKNNRKREKKGKRPEISPTPLTPQGDRIPEFIEEDIDYTSNLTVSQTVDSPPPTIYDRFPGEIIADKLPSSTESLPTTKSIRLSNGFPVEPGFPDQTTVEPLLEETQIHDSSRTTTLLQPTSHKTHFQDSGRPSQPVTLSFTTPVPPTTLTETHSLVPTATSHITSSQAAISPAFLTTELSSAVRTTSPPSSASPKAGSLTLPPNKPSEVSIIAFTVMKIPKQKSQETVLEDITPIKSGHNRRIPHRQHHNFPSQRMDDRPRLYPSVSPKKIEENMVMRTPYIHEESKTTYTFPVKGFMIITGIMGALAVFTIVVLISYAIIKCSKQPVVNNYQVSEQKSTTQ